jgi:hypothetical protein
MTNPVSQSEDAVLDDGGPAFPQGLSAKGQFGGMSLRDYFAGQVIAQIIAMYAADNKCGIGVEHIARNTAAHAYKVADALLAARKS